MKKEETIWDLVKNEKWSILFAFLAVFGIILFFAAALSPENPVQPESSSIVLIEPTQMPTATPTIAPTVTPTTVVIDLSRNLMALPAGSDGSFKAWESVDNITREDSAQYTLKQFYWFDEYGCARLGEYYSVAMGTYYADYIGETLIVELESRTIKVIIGDVKWVGCIDRMYSTDGSILEFIIKDGAINSEELNRLMVGKVLSIRKEYSE